MQSTAVIALVFLVTQSIAARADSYRIAFSELRAIVRHPLKVVRFSTKETSGRFDVDSEWRHGDLRIDIPTKSLETPESGAQGAFNLFAGRSPQIRFQSKQMLISRPDVHEGGKNWEAKLQGELTLFGVKNQQAFDIRCFEESPQFHTCQLKTVVPVDGYGVKLPELLGLKSSPLVEIESDISFAPFDPPAPKAEGSP